jgi:hypothetical protein
MLLSTGSGFTWGGLWYYDNGVSFSSFGLASGDGEIKLIPAPVITSVAPTSGTTAGDTSVAITGTNLTGATSVTFGGSAGTITANAATSITVTSPAHAAGTVDVQVTTAAGTSDVVGTGDDFTYVIPAPGIESVDPDHGSASGGATVTISGVNFAGATSVTFGDASATFTVNPSGPGVVVDTITATAPPHAAGTVQVKVTTPGGTSSDPARYCSFTYVAAPTITDLNPASGSAAGGTSVIITGTNLTGATSVNFGGAAATDVVVNSATQITCTCPAGTGTVDVTVATAAGTSPASAADQFTYVAANVRSLQVGWNIVAGGPGSSTGGLSLFGWNGSSYVSLNAGSMQAGTGYWCKANAAGNATLTAVPAPVSISLGTGWNLIGNPTSTSVVLPSGVAVFRFVDGSYVSATSLAPGEGGWVKSASTQVIQLQ